MLDLLHNLQSATGLGTWALAAILALVAMTLLWVVSLLKNDVSIVDVAWGPAFLLVTLVYWALGSDPHPRRLLVLALVAIWSLRLGAHIAWRSRGEGEDRRYAAMRSKVGPFFRWRSLVTVFWLQGALVSIVATPLLFIQTTEPSGSMAWAWAWTDLVGLLLWTIGFVFEAGADYQLLRFQSDPSNQGRVLDSGFWGLSRHPNYFGEACLWWGFFVFALGVPGGYWTLPSVLLMTFLLLKVSGVTLLEKTITKRRPKYQEYIESTPAFFPRLPFLGSRR